MTSATTDATCAAEGETAYTATCTFNGEEYTDIQSVSIPLTEHSYEAVVTEPTCTEGGYTTYTCSACGDTYTADETEATGHNYVDGVCTVCGATESGTGEHTHTYTSEVTTEATCTKDGVITCTCECGDSYTEVIPATGHTTEIQNAKDATCTEDSYTGDEVCTVCGETVSTGEVIPATGHEYVAVVTNPTCTKGGYTTYTCTVCGDSYTTNETEATGHSYEAVVTEPTCTVGGYTTYTCSVCGDSYTEVIPATGHHYVNGVCTVCGAKKPGADGSSWSGWGGSGALSTLLTNMMNRVFTMLTNLFTKFW